MDEMEFKVATFKGGVHPSGDGKNLSSGAAVQTAPLQSEYRVIIPQNIGAPPKVIVTPGQLVKKGEKIAGRRSRPDGGIGSGGADFR